MVKGHSVTEAFYRLSILFDNAAFSNVSLLVEDETT